MKRKKQYAMKTLRFVLVCAAGAIFSCNLTLPFLGEYYHNPKGTDTSTTTYDETTGCYSEAASSSITRFTLDFSESISVTTRYNQPGCTRKYDTTEIRRSISFGNVVATKLYDPQSQTLAKESANATEYDSVITQHTITCHAAACPQDMVNFFTLYNLAVPACNFVLADFTIGTATDVFSCMKGITDLQIANSTVKFNPYSDFLHSIIHYDYANRRLHEGSTHAETFDNQSDDLFDGSSATERHKYADGSTWYEKL